MSSHPRVPRSLEDPPQTASGVARTVLAIRHGADLRE